MLRCAFNVDDSMTLLSEKDSEQMRRAAMRQMAARTGFEPDGAWRNWWVEIMTSHNLRDLRGVLLALTYIVDNDEDPMAQALCVLVDSKITDERLDLELRMFRAAVRPELASRINVGFYRGNGELTVPVHPGPGFDKWLSDLIRTQDRRGASPGSTQHTVFAELVRAWLRRSEPQTTTAIQLAVGASYPTVSTVLRQLEGQDVLERTSDRRVALRKFPWDEWRRWIVASADARRTVRFVDRTGQARSPEEMVARLAKLQRDDVAVGGVLGAKHHFPGLDITGSVRLDLSVQGHKKAHELDFIRRIDAGLVASSDPMEKATVVVHFLGRHAPNSFEREGDTMWADPLECLSDLYDLRLDAQADEMLHALIRQRDSMPNERS